jgi:hypothetical protein
VEVLIVDSNWLCQEMRIVCPLGRDLNIPEGIPLSQERDLQKYSRTTQRRLIVGVLVIVFAVGVGLIYLIYGEKAGWAALICTGLGLVPVVLIGGFLWFLGWFARSARRE